MREDKVRVRKKICQTPISVPSKMQRSIKVPTQKKKQITLMPAVHTKYVLPCCCAVIASPLSPGAPDFMRSENGGPRPLRLE